MLGNAPLKSGFAALENFLWTASIAFPTWSGAIALFHSLIVGGISPLLVPRLQRHSNESAVR